MRRILRHPGVRERIMGWADWLYVWLEDHLAPEDQRSEAGKFVRAVAAEGERELTIYRKGEAVASCSLADDDEVVVLP